MIPASMVVTLGMVLVVCLILGLAPTPTARGAPDSSKIRVDEGFPVKITFALQPTLAIHEKMVTPAGWDNGEPINITTMFNSRWVTKRARKLMEMQPMTFKAAYSPDELATLQTMCGQERSVGTAQVITETYPDGTTMCYHGYLKSFIPDQEEAGKQPEATVTVVPTMFDVVNRTEEGPVITVVSGT